MQHACCHFWYLLPPRPTRQRRPRCDVVTPYRSGRESTVWGKHSTTSTYGTHSLLDFKLEREYGATGVRECEDQARRTHLARMNFWITNLSKQIHISSQGASKESAGGEVKRDAGRTCLSSALCPGNYDLSCAQNPAKSAAFDAKAPCRGNG